MKSLCIPYQKKKYCTLFLASIWFVIGVPILMFLNVGKFL